MILFLVFKSEMGFLSLLSLKAAQSFKEVQHGNRNEVPCNMSALEFPFCIDIVCEFT